MEVRNEESASRFVAQTEAGEAALTYSRQENGDLDLLHTMVPPEARGGGIASALVQAAVDHAREHGVGIVPSCPYVRAWIDRNPEHRDLVR